MNYWTDIQEQLVRDFISTDDIVIKNNIFTKLYPALMTMTKSILFRYYYNCFLEEDKLIHIQDGISDVYINLNKFDTNKGKAFSYIQTIIKNYFHDKFIQKTLNTKLLDDAYKSGISIIDEDNNDKFIYIDKNFEINDETISYNDIIELLQQKINDYLFKINNSSHHYSKDVISSFKRNIVTLETMIMLLKKGITSYERFIIDLSIALDIDILSIARRFRSLGFSCKYIEVIRSNYLDLDDGRKKKRIAKNCDWLLDDYNPLDAKLINHRLYMKHYGKRNEKININN